MVGYAGRAHPRALDHNFPTPLLDALSEFLPSVELRPIARIDQRLRRLSDDELVVQLNLLGYGRLITNDRMLVDPSTLVAIDQTRMSVFPFEGVGDEPVRATGAVLLDLLPALDKVVPHRPQVFRMRPRAPKPDNPHQWLERAAANRKTTAEALFEAHQRSYADLQRSVLNPPLEW